MFITWFMEMKQDAEVFGAQYAQVMVRNILVQIGSEFAIFILNIGMFENLDNRRPRIHVVEEDVGTLGW